MGKLRRGLLSGLGVILGLSLCLISCSPDTSPTPEDDGNLKQNVTSFNQKASLFYGDFVILQVERVRLAKRAEDGVSVATLMEHWERVQLLADKAYQTLDDLYLLATKIENSEATTSIPFFSATPAYANEKHGLVGTILSWTPVVGRFVTAFDQVSEGTRLGIYKTYQKTMEEGEPVDKQAIKELFESVGFDKPEDIFTCDPFKLREFYQDNYADFEEEVDFAKIAAEAGEQAVLAYVDGILSVTGGDMAVPDIPTDIEDYLKIALGKETVKEYLQGKLVDTGFEMLEESVTGSDMPQDKVTVVAKNEIQEAVTGVLGGQIQPYDDWTMEEKRAVAEKLNKMEEPLMVVTQTDTTATSTKVLVPAGDWDVLSTNTETAPVLAENAEVKEGSITQIVRIAVAVSELVENYPSESEKLDQSVTLAPGEVWEGAKQEPEYTQVKEEPEPAEIAEEPEVTTPEPPEEEAPKGVIHLVGTITVNSAPFESGTRKMYEGSGTIELFINDDDVTGRATGGARAHIPCTRTCGYYGEEDGKKGCLKDGVWYGVDEWMPLPDWDISLDAELEGWTEEPSEYLWTYAEIVARADVSSGPSWEIGGHFISDTEAEGFIDISWWYTEAADVMDQYGITWHATVQ